MKYAKIVIKNNYEKRGDLVLRSYLRALKRINANLLLGENEAYVYGTVDENNKFHELLTGEVIEFDYFKTISEGDILRVLNLPIEELYKIKKCINSVLFGNGVDSDSSIEEKAEDRYVEFDAYDKFLSRINPYERLSSDENQLMNFRYNHFPSKVKETNRIIELDRENDFDIYDLEFYESGQVLKKTNKNF